MKIFTGQTEEDIKRIALDGFLAVRDDAGHLLFRYQPVLKQIEIQRRGKKWLIDLKQFDKEDTFYRTNDPTRSHIDLVRNIPSAMSATNQGGVHGRLTNQ